jgi:O-antigen/teichoic acid export membrane protein
MRLSLKDLFSRQTSVRFNLSANLISKILSAVVSLACVPIYIQVLGVAGYGIIGIWATLETLATLLDLGLSPTMTRELAQHAEEAQYARDLVRTVEVVYWALGLLIGTTIVLSAPLITAHWLRSSQISPDELRASVRLIGVLIVCRWPIALYSSGLTGLERQVLLSWMGFVFALVRSLGAVFVIVFLSPTIFAFLAWQIAINIANTAIVAASLWWNLPTGGAARFHLKLLARVWKFAGGVTAIALVSVLLNDLDKIVVSGLVSLEDFGYYTLGSRMAGALYLASSSVFAAVYPALVRLATTQDEGRFAEFYHRSAQMMSLLIFPAAITAAFFAKPLIFAWTGNEHASDNTALIAALLIIGTAFHGILFLPYAAQLAHGWTGLAFWTNLAYVPVTTVLLVVLTKHFGGVGAAAVWLLITTSYFITYVPLMHRKLLRYQARQWYVNDVGIPLGACSITAGFLIEVMGPTTTRIGAALTVALAGFLIGIVGLLGTPLARNQVHGLWIRLLFARHSVR